MYNEKTSHTPTFEEAVCLLNHFFLKAPLQCREDINKSPHRYQIVFFFYIREKEEECGDRLFPARPLNQYLIPEMWRHYKTYPSTAIRELLREHFIETNSCEKEALSFREYKYINSTEACLMRH